jgi:transposase InsO family protein
VYRKHYPRAARLAERFADQTVILYVWRTGRALYGATVTDTSNRILARYVESHRYAREAVMTLENAAKLEPQA